jgi:hypothetical protein
MFTEILIDILGALILIVGFYYLGKSTKYTERTVYWIDVDDRLPIIPEGKYGIRVIVATFDPIYDEISGDGYEVYQASYSYTKGRSMYKNSDLKEDFMTLYIGGKAHSEYGPIGDPVTHWMYLPKPPKEKPKWF